MTSALRWAAMRAILMCHNCEGQSHKTVSTNHNFYEEKGEPKQLRTEVLPLTNLTPRPNRLTYVQESNDKAFIADHKEKAGWVMSLVKVVAFKRFVFPSREGETEFIFSDDIALSWHRAHQSTTN